MQEAFLLTWWGGFYSLYTTSYLLDHRREADDKVRVSTCKNFVASSRRWFYVRPYSANRRPRPVRPLYTYRISIHNYLMPSSGSINVKFRHNFKNKAHGH